MGVLPFWAACLFCTFLGVFGFQGLKVQGVKFLGDSVHIRNLAKRAQRARYPLIKKYTLNNKGIHVMI